MNMMVDLWNVTIWRHVAYTYRKPASTGWHKILKHLILLLYTVSKYVR